MTELEKAQCWAIVEALLSAKDSSIRITGPKPSIREKRYTVEACGAWTSYREFLFFGETCLKVLQKVREACHELSQS